MFCVVYKDESYVIFSGAIIVVLVTYGGWIRLMED